MPTAELDRQIAAERELSVTLRKYAGRWIAIREHRVIADADTAEELLDKTQGQPVDRRLRVPSGHGATLL